MGSPSVPCRHRHHHLHSVSENDDSCRSTLIRFLGSRNLCQLSPEPSALGAGAQGSAQARRAIAEGASRGADQPPVADKAVVEAVIDGQIAPHSGLLEAGSQTMAVVEQRVEAADD